MKRIGNIYQEIISLHNLQVADMIARRGKAGNKEIAAFDLDKDALLHKLHDTLVRGEYKTSEYSCFRVFEPKERVIYKLPYYPDRILQHAIMNVLEPIWTKTFTYNTYSCIAGRGIEGCAKRVGDIIAKYEGRPLYCLKIDITKYYPSIDNETMKMIVRRKIKDNDVLKLIDGIIDSSQGLPIGNYLSQYLSNLYLAYFMHHVNEVLKVDTVEYADDICFFDDNKESLHETFSTVKKYMEERLHLSVKGNYQIFPIAANRYDKGGRALDFVGYKFFRKQKLLRKRIKQNFCRKVAKINKVPFIKHKDYKRAVSPWLGWCMHSNSRHLIQKIVRKEYVKDCITKKDK